MSFDAVDAETDPHTVAEMAHRLWTVPPTEDDTPCESQAAETLVEQLGYRYFHLTYRFAVPGHGPVLCVLTNEPSEWRHRYDAKGYRRVDPVLQHALITPRPFAWKELPHRLPTHRKFFADARRHGLTDGISGAIRFGRDQIGLCTLSTPNGDPDFARETAMAHMMLLLSRSFESMRSRAVARHRAQRIALSARQAEVLRSVMRGASARETAAALGISQTMVERHLEAVRHKLGAPTSRAAAQRAIALNLIPAYEPESRRMPPND